MQTKNLEISPVKFCPRVINVADTLESQPSPEVMLAAQDESAIVESPQAQEMTGAIILDANEGTTCVSPTNQKTVNYPFGINTKDLIYHQNFLNFLQYSCRAGAFKKKLSFFFSLCVPSASAPRFAALR